MRTSLLTLKQTFVSSALVALLFSANALAPDSSCTVVARVYENIDGNNPLGSSTAAIFLTKDKKTAVKVFDKRQRALAIYEYWALRFLKEKGLPVPDAVGPPETMTAVTAEVAEYLRLNQIRPEDVVVFGRSYIDGIEPGLAARQGAPMDVRFQIEQKAKALFKSGEFRRWLVENKIDTTEMVQKYIDESDIAWKDFLYTKDGWVLIDP